MCQIFETFFIKDFIKNNFMNKDFKKEVEEIKRKLSIEKVLEKYGMLEGLKRTLSNNLYGPCPIHKGDNPHAFNVSLDKNLWNCFTRCGGGTVIDLIMKIENVSFKEAIKKAKRILKECNIEEYERKFKNIERNKPLEFRLILDHTHPYLIERRIKWETAHYFDIGYCNTGLLKGRIAIPIHDENGCLVAYAGRAINEKIKPKYKFPARFRKSLILYNYWRVKNNDNNKIVLVEGFFDVFRLYQAGYDAIALMGSSISDYQAYLLEKLDKKIIIMLDGDDAGRKGTEKLIEKLGHKIDYEIIYLPENKQPDDFGENELREIIG